MDIALNKVVLALDHHGPIVDVVLAVMNLLLVFFTRV